MHQEREQAHTQKESGLCVAHLSPSTLLSLRDRSRLGRGITQGDTFLALLRTALKGLC